MTDSLPSNCECPECGDCDGGCTTCIPDPSDPSEHDAAEWHGNDPAVATECARRWNMHDALRAENDRLRALLWSVSGQLADFKRPYLDPDGRECAVEIAHLIADDIVKELTP